MSIALADPGAVLRRRRRAGLRRELLQHGDRHAVRRLRASTGCWPRRRRSRRRGGRSAAAVGALRRHQRRRALRGDRVRHPARRCSTPPNGTPLYAPFHLAQTDPGDAARPPHGGRRRRVRADRRRDRLPAAGEPAGPAHQPRRRARDRRRARRRTAGSACAAASSGSASMVLLVPLGLLAPGTAFGEDGPGDLDLEKYGLRPCRRAVAKYSDWWTHTLLPRLRLRQRRSSDDRLLRVRRRRTLLIAGGRRRGVVLRRPPRRVAADTALDAGAAT